MKSQDGFLNTPASEGCADIIAAANHWQIINSSGSVVKYCTFEPFGRTIESGGTFNDPFGFTGQYFDVEIGEYYIRASSLRDISVGNKPLWDMQHNRRR